MIAAALPWLMEKLGGRGVSIALAFAAGMAALIAAYQMGGNAERKRGEAATLRAQVAVLKRDAKIAKDAADVARKIAEASEIAASGNAEKVHALEEELKRRPPADRGGLSPGDARRLRDIR
ncbi:MAG: hypothetical protein DI527_00840 [Chelatococcus sp.]|nr:MAG: hypothetical protein DI527_00840 [Chelatococcus sp.]